MNVALIALILLWWALIAYAVLGGADFGAGVWNLFAFGRMGERHRNLINHALGPVWEANHVWLIFLIVGLFTVFPSAFAALSVALFLPFTIVLIGLVLRGAAFVFRYYATNQHGAFARWWGRVFGATSLITPFFLGTSAAAVASGQLLTPDGGAQATRLAPLFTPFTLTVGAMAVALCSTLAAVYLAVDARDGERDSVLAESYRWRALIAGGITAVLGFAGLALSINEAPLLWQDMLAAALPVVITALLLGLATATALLFRHYRLARVLVIAGSAFILGAWGLSQYPYIVPPHMTIYNTANEASVITTLLIAIGAGLVVLLPSLYYLFSVFKTPHPEAEKSQ